MQETLREAICSEIARLLKEERLRQKFSLNALSSAAGLNRQTVSFIEQEQRTPTIDTLLRLTDALGVSLEDLIVKACKEAIKLHDRQIKEKKGIKITRAKRG